MNAAFYCVADERYFLGAVALVNSLRLQGHEESIYVLDRGLRADQRRLLGAEATLVEGPSQAPPWLQKTIAPLRHPAEVMVLIDADMIATRSLGELIGKAAAGGVVAFANDTDRFVAEWGPLLDLGPIVRRPYVSSGLVFLGGSKGREVLELLADRQDRVEIELTFAHADLADYPFRYPEQDVLNAILARPDHAQVLTLDSELAATPPYRGLAITDESALRCAYADGREPYVLHQFVRKPWLEPMYHGVYPRLFARLLLGEDVEIKVPVDQVPVRMRSGIRARAERVAVNALDLGRWYATERLPGWAAERLGSRSRRAERR